MKAVPPTKRYLGRGITVDHDARGLVLTSENRFGVMNTIILEPEVFLELLEYLGIEPRRGIRDTRRP
jgi:hypothetical protein